jgi:hypothetical protein
MERPVPDALPVESEFLLLLRGRHLPAIHPDQNNIKTGG